MSKLTIKQIAEHLGEPCSFPLSYDKDRQPVEYKEGVIVGLDIDENTVRVRRTIDNSDYYYDRNPLEITLSEPEPKPSFPPLKKPICFFDLETTGIDPEQDEIIEIAVMRINPDYSVEKFHTLLQPSFDIPEEATKVHGITNADVKDSDSFNMIAFKLFNFFSGCDIGGFNILRFDVPLLMRQMKMCGYEFPGKDVRFIDSCTIFHKFNPRTLTGAVKHYCGIEEREDAHSALVDTEDSFDVFIKQVQQHFSPSEDIIQDIHTFCTADLVDYAGKLKRNAEGVVCYAFGKDINKSVNANPGFAHWMLRQSWINDNTRWHIENELRPKPETQPSNPVESDDDYPF